MQIVRGIISFIFILFILVGSSGLKVFTHSCEEDGIFTSYLIQLEDHCEDEKEDLPSCCQTETQKEDDCCNDEVEVYKVKFDYFQDVQLDVPFLALQPEAIKINYAAELRSVTATEQPLLRPPPNSKSGRQLLILHQVFRI